jgi:hypothetical protein
VAAGRPYGTIALEGPLAYLVPDNTAGGSYGVGVFDVSDPRAPARIGGFPAAGSVHGVAVAERVAFYAAPSGLIITDLHDPQRPQDLGSFDRPRVSEVDLRAIAGRYGYGLAGQSLAVLDLLDPAAPRIAGTLPLRVPDGARLVGVGAPEARAILLYDVAGGRQAGTSRSELHVVDVSNPSTPQPGGVLALGEGVGATALAIAGQYAFVGVSLPPPPGTATRLAAVKFFDLSAPAQPREVGSIAVPFNAARIVADERRLIVGNRTETLVVDIGDPARPAPLGVVAAAGGTSFGLSGAALYAGNGEQIARLDVADPTRPHVQGTYVTQAEVVTVEGSIVYTHRSATGRIEAIDFRDPVHPELVAWFEVPGQTTRVVVSGGHVYAVSSGLNVIRFLVGGS